MRNGIHLGLVCDYDLKLTGLMNINVDSVNMRPQRGEYGV